jgi:hypothetical protein
MLIKIFPRTPKKKAHSNSSQIFSYDLIFSEEIIQYSRTFCTTSPKMSWNQAHATPPGQELSKDTKNTI